MKLSLPSLVALSMMAFTLRLLFLLRFLCFMSLVYLGLHIIFARLISRPDSRVLWFFAVLTSPLTRPFQMWIAPNSSEPHRRLPRELSVISFQLSVLMSSHRDESRARPRLEGISTVLTDPHSSPSNR